MTLLTWCANLQPAAGLEDLRAFLQGQAREVRRARGGEEPLGLGLWLPGRLVSRLKENPGELRALEQEFSREGFFLATANVFPMGRFHGEGVKEKVYLPSWASQERLDYTLRAMEVAAVLARKGEVLAVSTLPLGWPRGAGEAKALLREGTANLVRAAQGAEETSQQEGVDLVLSVEPEPGCLLEKAADLFRCFEKDLLPAARKEGMEEVCRRRIGLGAGAGSGARADHWQAAAGLFYRKTAEISGDFLYLQAGLSQGLRAVIAIGAHMFHPAIHLERNLGRRDPQHGHHEIQPRQQPLVRRLQQKRGATLPLHGFAGFGRDQMGQRAMDKARPVHDHRRAT